MAQIPVVQRFCSCTDEFYNPCMLGKNQKKFEELKRKGMSNFEVLNTMKVVKLCCREGLFNPAMIFINSENVGRLIEARVNTTIISSGISKISKNQETIKDTPDILPKYELPELP